MKLLLWVMALLMPLFAEAGCITVKLSEGHTGIRCENDKNYGVSAPWPSWQVVAPSTTHRVVTRYRTGEFVEGSSRPYSGAVRYSGRPSGERHMVFYHGKSVSRVTLADPERPADGFYPVRVVGNVAGGKYVRVLPDTPPPSTVGYSPRYSGYSYRASNIGRR